MRVLVVDDENDVLVAIARALKLDEHAVTTACDMASARERIAEGTDLIVLDLRLPDGFGLDLCREIRAAGATIPILVLTASSHVSLRVKGLDAGADDFMAKPFAIAELRARVRALGRRGGVSRDLVYVFEDVRLDFAGRAAQRGDKPIAVTAKEWSILEVLANHAGRFVARADLLEGVWGDASESAAGSLQVLVARLRRKLGSSLIRTLRGEGYSLAEGRKVAP